MPIMIHGKEYRVCSIEGCNGKHEAKGYCSKHYQAFKKHGDPLKKYERPNCSIAGCIGKNYGKGYCEKHWIRYHKYGDPLFTKTEMHGMENSKEYRTWVNMKVRCYNPKQVSYERYGGRGITVCDRWKDSFIAFHEDMGGLPFKSAQIDRIDNDGNYNKDNCRWVEPRINARNRGNNKLTIEEVRVIRNTFIRGANSEKEYGNIFKVSSSMIGLILRNERWEELTQCLS